ncbi:hypothetical protein Tco_0240974 [Tanacetum coccineum]
MRTDLLVSQVAHANSLKIVKCNQRLISTLKSNEATIQVVLDALKLTPFYKAFEVTTNVPEVYMQEFWATVSLHYKSLRFKMNDKSHIVNLENFRDMLQICPRLPGHKFKDPPFEEEIISFIRDLGHTREIKGMYNKKNVDYVYLLWEDLVYQVENKNSKKNNDMCYPRFTKVIIDYFMLKDQSISRRNKMFWHTARDDPMFNTIRVISKHQDTQIYGSILPDEFINQEIKDFEAYKQYYAIASRAEPPKAKTKYKKKADGSDTSSKPKLSASVPKAKGLETLSEVALSEHEQMKIATKRSKTQFHSSNASGSGDGADTQSEVPDEQQQKDDGDDEDDDNDEHGLNDEKDDADDDAKNDSEETKSDDDGDDFVHPNLSTYKADDQEEEKEEEKADDDDEVSSDQKVSTPPDHEFTEEEENQKGDDYVKEGEQEDEEEEMYGDLNLNLERRDVEMTDAQTNQDMEDVHVTLTTEPPVVQQQSSSVSSDLVSKYINPSLDTCIDSILNQNVQSPNLVNVLVSVAVVTPSSVTTIPQNPVPIIQIQETSQFAEVVSSIPAIVDNYLASKMKDAVDAIIKDQVKAQVSKILPKVEKYVIESLGAEVLVRSINKPQTSYTVAASISEFELKKILIDKIEENKSMNRSDIQKNLYNALIESYNSDKDIFSSYGDVVTFKRGRDDQDKDEDPSVGSN